MNALGKQILGTSLKGYRYIRDYGSGNSNTASGTETKIDWVEIKALLQDNTNIALNKSVTTNGSVLYGNLSSITNNNTDASVDFVSVGNNLKYVQIDLGGLFDIKKIQIWRYYFDTRTYFDTKTQISADGINWVTVFDSAVSGTYAETATGKEILIP